MPRTVTHVGPVGRERVRSTHSGTQLVTSTLQVQGGSIADRYRVSDLLGQGGMGTVYAATDLASGKRIALKRTLDSASPKVRELFKREFYTLRGLRHPNIIEVYDYGRDGDANFYTMELLEGCDLGGAAPLSWRLVCQYMRQIAAPLSLLHARRLLHRDISPRNIWVFPDGRLKLIDFGALSPFGVPTEVVGTLPLLAPEWLQERPAAKPVDQRADLYSLGALGYWLLTARYAYGTPSDEEVPYRWVWPPPAPSELANRLQNGSLETIPAELDALILALLRPEAAARPESTERVIDRIDAVVGPTTDPVDHAMRGCLRSRAFVGRRSELQRFERCLRATECRALAIEAEPGLGRSRLLEELSVVGTLSGAICVLVSGERREQAYGVVNSIALGLLERMPAQAEAAARPFAGLLAQLSAELRAKLDIPAPAANGSSRQQLQEGLTDWLCALAAQRPIVILIDDIERADEESLAWLAALARQRSARLLLIAALVHEPNTQPGLLLQAFQRVAERIRLAPLSASEVGELLHSVFGPVDYLGRVAHVVHRASQGSPAHCVELLEELVTRGIVRYAEGAWTLPGQLSEAELPRSRSELHLARLRHVSEPAQRLARYLSIDAGPMTRSQCAALSELDESSTSSALVELVLGGVLLETEQGYGFLHADVRRHASTLLDPGERTRAHTRLAAELSASLGSDPVDALRAALHMFSAGTRRRAERLVAKAVWGLVETYQAQARLPAAVPLLVQTVELFRRAGCGERALVAPLSALAIASYCSDARLAERYGRAALSALERELRLPWARALGRYIGRRLALYVALAAATLSQRCVRELLYMLVVTHNSLNAVATSSFDYEMLASSARPLQLLAVLGDRDLVGLLPRIARTVAGILSERPAATLAQMYAIQALLESDVPIRHLPDERRRDAVVSALFPIGIMECWRMNPAALAMADRLEAAVSLDATGADHLRAVYYSMRGERARAEEHRRRVETRALQAGNTWHVVTLGPLDAHFTSLWTHDALLAKHAAAELERLSREFPSLRHEALRARATYLVLCGRYREVIETMRTADAPRELLGWSRGQGVLARAHNRLGEHARARQLCEAALEGRSEEDLGFVVMNLHVQLELALAESALGEHGRARERSQRLLARHEASVGPLLLGAIHETCSRVALLAGDCDRARLHCAALQRCYAPSENATLIELGEQLIRQIAASTPTPAAFGPCPSPDVSLLGDDTELITRVHLSRCSEELAWTDRVRRGLQLALELTDAHTGFVVASAEHGDVIALDTAAPEPDALQWVHTVRTGHSTATADMLLDSTMGYIATQPLSGTLYCMFTLRSATPNDRTPPVLVLGFRETRSSAPDQQALVRLAYLLRSLLP